MIETWKVLSGIYDTSVSPEIPIISEYATCHDVAWDRWLSSPVEAPHSGVWVHSTVNGVRELWNRWRPCCCEL